MKKNLKKRTVIAKTFIKGLTVIVPVAVSVYVLYLVIRAMEAIVKKGVTTFFAENYYIPGMGVVAFVGVVLLVGLLMYPLVTRSLFRFMEAGMRKIPLVGSIYSPVKDIMNLLGEDLEHSLGEPVFIKMPNSTVEMLGFVTRGDSTGLPAGLLPEDHVVVFIPWSSQIGGLSYVVPRSSLREVDLTAEEAIRWSFTAGISGPDEGKK